MPADPTVRLQLASLVGSDPINQIDEVVTAIVNKLESEAAIVGWGTADARPTAGTKGRWYWAEDLFQMSYDNGVRWTAVNPSLETELPSAPEDGDEVFFLANATAGLVWHLRYRTASPSAHKWEFVGGNSAFFSGGTADSASGTSPSVFAGNIISVALDGDYDVSYGAQMQLISTPSYTGSVYLKGSDGNGVPLAVANVGVDMLATMAFSDRRSFSAGTTLSLAAAVNVAGKHLDVTNAWAKLTPVRVG